MNMSGSGFSLVMKWHIPEGEKCWPAVDWGEGGGMKHMMQFKAKILTRHLSEDHTSVIRYISKVVINSAS